jgi:putative oxidoreductase
MIQTLQSIDTQLNPLRSVAILIAAPLWDLAARLYLGYAFFSSGILRFKDFLNGTWSNQIFLFMEEHPVPGIPADFSAPLATAGELALPVLLVLGLFGRFAAAGLLVMTAVIELTYIHATDHILWAFLALSILIRGAGLISLDALILHWIRKPM